MPKLPYGRDTYSLKNLRITIDEARPGQVKVRIFGKSYGDEVIEFKQEFKSLNESLRNINQTIKDLLKVSSVASVGVIKTGETKHVRSTNGNAKGRRSNRTTKG